MKKPIYNVVRFRNTDKCVLGENKKIANKKNGFVINLINDNEEEDDTIYDQPTGLNFNSIIKIPFKFDQNTVHQFNISVSPPTAKQKVVYRLTNNLETVTLTPNGLLTIQPTHQDEEIIVEFNPVDAPEMIFSLSVDLIKPSNITNDTILEYYFDKPITDNVVRQLTASVYPDNASQDVVFELSEDVNGVTVTPNGLVTITPLFDETSFTVKVYPLGYPNLDESIYLGVNE